MRYFDILRHRMRSIFNRSAVERELQEELRFHAEMATLPAVDQIKEECRDARGLGLIENIARDMRHGLRLLARSPGFTVVAVITLALGIGANSAIFSVVDAVMLRPLPYPDSARLVSIWERHPKDPDDRSSVSPANLADYQQATQVLAGLSAWSAGGANISGDGPAERLITGNVNYNYFDVLGVQPSLGRGFLKEEDRPESNHVVIISHDLWERRYGLDPAILGRKILLDEVPHIVVGVMPDHFDSPHHFFGQSIQAYLPLGFDAEALSNSGRGDHEVDVLARMRPGVTLSQTSAALNAISERLSTAYPQTNKEVRTGVGLLLDDIVRSEAPALKVLLGAVGMILLVACVNVANLLLVRGASQRREIAVRLALGARRARICGELFVRSALLAALGCVAGLVLGAWTRRLLVYFAPPNVPRIEAATLDWRVLGFTMAIAAGSTILFGLLPAWQASGVGAGDALKAGRGSATSGVMRWRNALLVAEVAISLVLTIGAGLLLHSFVRLAGVDLGFHTDHVLAMNVPLPQVNYPTAQARANFFDRLQQRVEAIPGVQSAFFASQLPMRGGWETGIEIEGMPSPQGNRVQTIGSQAVSPTFFSGLGLQLTSGRFLTPADREGALPVIVINETAARQFWPGRDPLGRRARRGSKAPWLTVVGMVRDARLRGQDQGNMSQMFIPVAQVGSYPVRVVNFAVRTSGDPWTVLPSIQSVLRELDPEQPIFQPVTFTELVSRRVADRRFMAMLLVLFAGVALALAVVGVYGVMAYSVTQRVPEIGVRVALGASPGNIVGLFLRRAALLTIAGVVIGTAAAAALSKYLVSLLFEIKPTDALTFATVAGLVCFASLAACYLPARRAARVDPMVALRYE